MGQASINGGFAAYLIEKNPSIQKNGVIDPIAMFE